jgi:putative ABC transport system permease protein
MRIVNLLKIAYRSLAKNKLRVLLTMLGIIIGVASVIAMLAIGQGSKQNIQSSVASLGTNSVMVYPGSSSMGGVRMGAGSYSTLTAKDADAIAARCEYVTDVTPVVQKSSQVIAGNQNWHTMVAGGLTQYFKIRNLTIARGSIFSANDERTAAKVCVIGYTVSDNLFGVGGDPIGKFIRINSIPFKVVGLMERKGQNSFGQDQDDIIIAPFPTVQKRMLSTIFLNSILISARSENDIEKAKEQITEILRLQHRLAPAAEEDFTVRSQADIANIFGSISKIMTVLLASIAGISLLVGGIGIMNIMLVSVTERTREIGIRMAVGATGRDVLIQFMIEAIFISFLGGLIGIAVGVLAAMLVGQLAGWPVVITLSSILLAFVFSSVVGLFFGWYPARKAAALNPIDALRYE